MSSAWEESSFTIESRWGVAAPGATLRTEELLAWCRDRLSPLERPAAIEVREEMPRSPLGKILRRELHDPTAAAMAAGAAAAARGDGTRGGGEEIPADARAEAASDAHEAPSG